MSTEWFYGFSHIRQVPDHEPDPNFDNIRSKWIGRSCGCRLRTLETDALVNDSGIVVYPGHKFKEEVTDTHHTVHINTKNGPLTINSNLVYKQGEVNF